MNTIAYHQAVQDTMEKTVPSSLSACICCPGSLTADAGKARRCSLPTAMMGLG